MPHTDQAVLGQYPGNWTCCIQLCGNACAKCCFTTTGLAKSNNCIQGMWPCVYTFLICSEPRMVLEHSMGQWGASLSQWHNPYPQLLDLGDWEPTCFWADSFASTESHGVALPASFIIGLHFFEESKPTGLVTCSVTAVGYRQMLLHYIIPQLQQCGCLGHDCVYAGCSSPSHRIHSAASPMTAFHWRPNDYLSILDALASPLTWSHSLWLLVVRVFENFGLPKTCG